MLIAFRVRKASNRNPEYEVLITFPLQKRLHERTLMLCYTYICFVCHEVLQLINYLTLLSW